MLRLCRSSRLGMTSNRCASTRHEVPDQRDNCQYQQKVNESDRHVECDKAENPRHEQDNR